jgi:hypothetical protein
LVLPVLLVVPVLLVLLVVMVVLAVTLHLAHFLLPTVVVVVAVELFLTL